MLVKEAGRKLLGQVASVFDEETQHKKVIALAANAAAKQGRRVIVDSGDLTTITTLVTGTMEEASYFPVWITPAVSFIAACAMTFGGVVPFIPQVNQKQNQIV